jgi:MFS family permease
MGEPLLSVLAHVFNWSVVLIGMKLSDSALWTLITSMKLTVMTGSIVVPVINVMRDSFGVTPASAGFIISVHALFAALFYPVFKTVTRKGTKIPLVSGLFLYGISGGAGLVITSYWVLLVSRAVLGIGLAAVLTSITALLEPYTEEERSNLMGLRGSSTGFGSINWPVFGGFLGIFSWHLPFAVYLLAIPLGILALVRVPDIKKDSPTIETQAEHAAVREYCSGSVFGITLLGSVLLFTILIFVPQLLERIGISFPFFISLYVVVIMISSALAAPVYRRINRDYTRSVLVVLVFWVTGCAIISQTGSGLVIAASVALFGIGEGLVALAVADRVNTSVPLPFRDRINTHVRIFRFTGQVLAPVIFFPVVVLNEIFLAAAAACAVFFVFFSVYEMVRQH